VPLVTLPPRPAPASLRSIVLAVITAVTVSAVAAVLAMTLTSRPAGAAVDDRSVVATNASTDGVPLLPVRQ